MLRFSLFTLEKYIKEEQFLHQDGLRELIDIINTMTDNTRIRPDRDAESDVAANRMVER